MTSTLQEENQQLRQLLRDSMPAVATASLQLHSEGFQRTLLAIKGVLSQQAEPEGGCCGQTGECDAGYDARLLKATPAPEAEGVQETPDKMDPKLEAVYAQLGEFAAQCSELKAALSAVTAERDRLQLKWARVESERDQLRAKVGRLQQLVGASEEVELHLQQNSDVDRIRADALRQDAERYRWLVASGVNVTSVGGDPVRLTDRLVDAAMTAKERS